MTSMFKDIDLSKDMHPEFNANKSNQVQGIELSSIQVLTQGTWPMKCSDIPNCKLPPIMKDLAAKFERYYEQRAHNKKLFWLNQYGSAEISPTFKPEKPYMIIATSFQASILNCFNDGDVQTLQEL